MPRYERHVLSVDENGLVDCPGRVVAVLDCPNAGQRRITALVEIKEPATVADDPEGVTGGFDPETSVKARFFCNAETATGRCSREVDGPDERCWQHPDEDETETSNG